MASESSVHSFRNLEKKHFGKSLGQALPRGTISMILKNQGCHVRHMPLAPLVLPLACDHTLHPLGRARARPSRGRRAAVSTPGALAPSEEHHQGRQPHATSNSFPSVPGRRRRGDRDGESCGQEEGQGTHVPQLHDARVLPAVQCTRRAGRTARATHPSRHSAPHTRTHARWRAK